MSEARAGQLRAVLDAIPYVRFLGIKAELAGDEMTALAQLSIFETLSRQPKTIDVAIEYLRPARPFTTYARAEVRKSGRRIANVHVEAWQETRASPVAFLRGHFLLSHADGTD